MSSFSAQSKILKGLVLLTLLLSPFFTLQGELNQALAGPNTKVVIIGFDGADPTHTEKFMEEGVLPNLAGLKNNGAFSLMGTTNPPQSLVSWSAFATGKDAGQNGIFDFFHRDPKTHAAESALTRQGKKDLVLGKYNATTASLIISITLFLLFLFARRLLKLKENLSLGIAIFSTAFIGYLTYNQVKILLPEQLPTVFNKRKGRALWEVTGANKINTQIIRAPGVYPPPKLEYGLALSGLGVPDVRGTIGSYSFYTNSPLEEAGDTEMGGKITLVEFQNNIAETMVLGPINNLFENPDEIKVPLRLEKSGPNVLVIEASEKTQALRVGEWSDWFVFDFEYNSLIRLKGMSRFYLVELEPHLKLYMPPISLSPEHSPVRISHPKGYAKELCERFGFFNTLGWLGDTWALTEGRSNEKIFLEDLYFSLSKFEEMMENFLADKETRLYIQVFDFVDRVNHMFWQNENEEPPANNGQLTGAYEDALKNAYMKMDEIVGKAMKRLDNDTVFMVVSNHGVASYEKSLNTNRWLVENGFMTLNSGKAPIKKLGNLFRNDPIPANVDWSRTKAYSLGFGSIYINLKGRETGGIVEPGNEYEEIRSEIVWKLEGFEDPDTGARPVFKVYKREEMYSNFDGRTAPDLRAANNKGYRASWQTALGGVPSKALEPNTGKWKGAHASLDPSLVPGFLFVNRKVELNDPHITDIFPTVCNLFGIAAPSDVKGKALPLAPYIGEYGKRK